MIEVYKYFNGLSPDIMRDTFKLRENTYSLRNFHIFESHNPTIKTFGLGSITYRVSQLWKNVPEEIRYSTSLPTFKKIIKKVPLIFSSCTTSCSPEFRINLALYIELCNSDKYSAISCLHFWLV